MSESSAGKTDKRRPMQISRAQYNLNCALLAHKIIFKQWEKKTAELKDKNVDKK